MKTIWRGCKSSGTPLCEAQIPQLVSGDEFGGSGSSSRRCRQPSAIRCITSRRYAHGSLDALRKLLEAGQTDEVLTLVASLLDNLGPLCSGPKP